MVIEGLMDVQNIVFIVAFLAALSLLLLLAILFRKKFWTLFGPVLPYLLVGIFLFNLISFQMINRPYFNWAYQGVIQRLPSNGLIDLYVTSGTPIKPRWIYTVIETYYQGRSLIIPEDLVESLDLSLDLLKSQAQLIDVDLVQGDWDISPADLEVIMALDPDMIQTQKLNSKGNVTQELGDIYHFVEDPADSQSALVLLRFDNKLFFVPESVLQTLGGDS